jgi:hypothetical protein
MIRILTDPDLQHSPRVPIVITCVHAVRHSAESSSAFWATAGNAKILQGMGHGTRYGRFLASSRKGIDNLKLPIYCLFK